MRWMPEGINQCSVVCFEAWSEFAQKPNDPHVDIDFSDAHLTIPYMFFQKWWYLQLIVDMKIHAKSEKQLLEFKAAYSECVVDLTHTPLRSTRETTYLGPFDSFPSLRCCLLQQKYKNGGYVQWNVGHDMNCNCMTLKGRSKYALVIQFDLFEPLRRADQTRGRHIIEKKTRHTHIIHIST